MRPLHAEARFCAFILNLFRISASHQLLLLKLLRNFRKNYNFYYCVLGESRTPNLNVRNVALYPLSYEDLSRILLYLILRGKLFVFQRKVFGQPVGRFFHKSRFDIFPVRKIGKKRRFYLFLIHATQSNN